MAGVPLTVASSLGNSLSCFLLVNFGSSLELRRVVSFGLPLEMLLVSWGCSVLPGIFTVCPS